MTPQWSRPSVSGGARPAPYIGARPIPVRRRNLGALAAGLLFIALAVFALLRVTVLKDRLPTEATANQVYGVAFTLAMVGVAIVQGTALARRTVVVLATLALLGVLVGLSMVIEQQELPQAVWLIAAAVVMLPYLALLALLVGESPSPWRVAIGTLVLAGYGFGSYALEAGAQRELDRRSRAQIAEWVGTETSFSDATLGFSLDPPDGWDLLDRGSDPVAREGGRLGLAHAQSMTLAILQIEEMRDGPGSARAYVDRMRREYVKGQDGMEELGVKPVKIGAVDGEELTARWSYKDRRMRGWFVGWKDGWRYFALYGWVPEARADAGTAAFEGLLTSVRFTPIVSRDFEELRRAVEEIAPHISPAAVRALVDRYPTRKLTAPQVFRLAHRASFYGLPGLSGAEAAELKGLTTILYGKMSARDLERFGSYQERVRQDTAIPPAEDKDVARLVKATTSQLPEESRLRLQSLLEKAIVMGALMERSS
jgi:hypothetical protein